MRESYCTTKSTKATKVYAALHLKDVEPHVIPAKETVVKVKADSPSPRRKPGSSAVSKVFHHWIPAFAGMTTIVLRFQIMFDRKSTVSKAGIQWWKPL